VWWAQKGQNAGLVLALAYLLTMSPLWQKSKIIIKTIIFSEGDRADTEKGLRAFLEQGRVDADIEVILGDESTLFSTIKDKSLDADFVFIGLRPPAPEEPIEEYTQYYSNLVQKSSGVPPTAYVLAAEDINFQKIFSSLS